MSDAVVVVEQLAKTLSLGLVRLPARPPGTPPGAFERFVAKVPFGKALHHQVEAVRGVSFEVRANEIFGFLGPNGAGKTTTIKLLLGLLFPTSGSARLFGYDASDVRSRQHLGFLPENPYLYQYLTGREFLDLAGRLAGLDAAERRKQCGALLERVGLAGVAERPSRTYSKGQLQRLGLAQALLGSPELLILDEPMTGLDPIGRKEVRDLLLEEKKKGRTLFFSSHILSDVEMLCDRVGIMQRGSLVAYGRLDELLRPEVQHTDVELVGASEALEERCKALAAVAEELLEARKKRAELAKTLEGTPSNREALEAESAALDARCKELEGRFDPKIAACRRVGRNLVVTIEGAEGVEGLLQLAREANARVASVIPKRETLEDLFVRQALVTG